MARVGRWCCKSEETRGCTHGRSGVGGAHYWQWLASGHNVKHAPSVRRDGLGSHYGIVGFLLPPPEMLINLVFIRRALTRSWEGSPVALDAATALEFAHMYVHYIFMRSHPLYPLYACAPRASGIGLATRDLSLNCIGGLQVPSSFELNEFTCEKPCAGCFLVFKQMLHLYQHWLFSFLLMYYVSHFF